MESTHLLTGSKKRVKIHPHTVTAKYATQPGDDGYDDAPSFEDFGSFLEETSDKKKLMESRRWPLTLFAAKGPGKGVGEQLASFGEASVSASRLTWVLLLCAALAHGCLIVLTRLASEQFHFAPLFLLTVRSVVQLLSVAVPLLRGENPFGPEGYRLRLFCYGVAYSLSLCCAYSSLTFVSAGNATTTWRLATTALSAVLAFLLLEERLGLSDVITIAAGLCGLGLLLLPTTDEGNSDAPTNPVTFWKGAFGWSLSALAGLWMALALVGYRSLKDRRGHASTALLHRVQQHVLPHVGVLQSNEELIPAGEVCMGRRGKRVPCRQQPRGGASITGQLGSEHRRRDRTKHHPVLKRAELRVSQMYRNANKIL
uniref:Solute carrier family 35 member G2a n=1 Tax=Oryzias melastigma TaxID=30732 RepID=A0A3B3C9B3_ORYME